MYDRSWYDKPENETWLVPIAIVGLTGMALFGLGFLLVVFHMLKTLLNLLF